MNSPRLVLGPPVRDGKPYAEIAHTAQSVAAFVAIDRALARRGVVGSGDLSRRISTRAFCSSSISARKVSSTPRGSRSRSATPRRPNCWRRCTRKQWPSRLEAAPGVFHDVPPFDRDAMMIEAELLVDWYVPLCDGEAGRRGRSRRFPRGLERGLRPAGAAPKRALMLRDFHSPNIIWRGEQEGPRPARRRRFPGCADRPVGL